MTMTSPPTAPTREDLFGPLPPPDRDAGTRLRRALARLIVQLAATRWRTTADTAPLIAAVRSELDVATGPSGARRARIDPRLGAWLPSEDATRRDRGSLAELALLLDAVETATPMEVPGWARQLHLRFAPTVIAEMASLDEAEGLLQATLARLLGAAGLRRLTAAAPRMVPPAIVLAEVFAGLPGLDRLRAAA
jgi:hypothetical protein